MFLRLAYKAQSQCRSTLQALSDIKNPSVVYAKQANITHGNQQVNNGVTAPRTQENKIYSNELLEHTHGERLDTREKNTASCINSELAAVEYINRRTNATGKGDIIKKCSQGWYKINLQRNEYIVS